MRRAWWGLGAVFALVVVLWFVRTELLPPDVALPGAASASNVVPEPAPGDTIARQIPVAAQRSAEHGPDEIELCGGLWVKTKPDGNIDEDDFSIVVRLPEARARLLDELRADSSEFARAAAIRLGLIGSESPLVTSADMLARMASVTKDPQVYALAFNLCVGSPNEGACQLLSAEQWARLDPGNAVPWMFALGRAVDRRDVPAQSEALHRIATSTRSELHWLALSGLVLDHMPDDDASTPAALTLAVETLGVEASFSHPGFNLVTKVCKGAPLRDLSRRESCAAAAELLVEKSDTLFEQGIGFQIGAQLGWPAERLQLLRAESAAYFDSFAGPNTFAQTAGCADIRRDLEGVRLRARLGEVAASRAWIAQSGKRPEDFLQAGRAAQASRAAEAASAAVAASAASAAR